MSKIIYIIALSFLCVCACLYQVGLKIKCACVYEALFCDFLNCSRGNEPSESQLRSDKLFVFSSSSTFWSILDLQSFISFRCVAKWFHYTCTYIWASVVAQMVNDLPAIQVFDPWVSKNPWRRKWQLTTVFLPGESHRRWVTFHRVSESQTWLSD